MAINKKKTKCMVLGRKGERINIKIENEIIEQVEKFKYLGSIITENLTCSMDVKSRIAIAKIGFINKKKLLCGPLKKELSKRLEKCYV